MNQDDKYIRARKRVKAKKGFYSHLSTYVVVGTFFLGLNMLTDPFDVWWPFPMLSWGIGLAIHYLSVFGFPGSGVMSKEWEDQEMEKELRRVGYEPEEELMYEEEEDLMEPEDELDLRDIRRERQEGGLNDEDEFV